MYERCLNETERLLATSKTVILPVKAVWRLLAAEGKRRTFDVPALTDFNALLEGDKRFEIISAQIDPDEADSLLSDDGEEVDSNLGTLGFYPEDRVKLRRTRFPDEGSNGARERRAVEDEEDVVPFNVKGLSATKPVHPAEAKKQNTEKKTAKAAVRSSSSFNSRLKKQPKKGTPSRKSIRKSPRRTR